MAESVQSYKNHNRLLPPFHFFVLPVLLINAINSIRHVWMSPTQHYAFELVVAVALLTGALLSRTQALAAQDRVIRLEMRLRLRALLPQDLQARINDLTTSQVVALRFASDVELTDLVRDVLAGKLPKQKDIKTRVKNWQADWQRV